MPDVSPQLAHHPPPLQVYSGVSSSKRTMLLVHHDTPEGNTGLFGGCDYAHGTGSGQIDISIGQT